MTEHTPAMVRREEEAYLSRVNQRIPERLKEVRAVLAQVKQNGFSGGRVGAQQKPRYERERDDLLSLQKRPPYFGRFDIRDCSSGSPATVETFYVGYASIETNEGGDCPNQTNHLVVDHRAAICSLFRRYTGPGAACYDAPDGTVNVDFLGLRRITIQDGQIVTVFDGQGKRLDVEAEPSTNEFNLGGRWIDPLLAVLERRHAAGRLGDIVETIQAEQDAVIRRKADVLVVQGPAGSGKTVCALQRAAQLLFDRREHQRTLLSQRGIEQQAAWISAQQILVLSPNAIFSNYISQVLPDLNEEAIRQALFDEELRRTLRARLPVYTVTGPDGNERRRAYQLEKRRDRYEALLGASTDSGRMAGAAFKGSHALLAHLQAHVAALTVALEAVFAVDILLDDYHSGDEGDAPGVFFGRHTLVRLFREALNNEQPPARALDRVFAAVRARERDYTDRRVVSARTRARLAREVDTFEQDARTAVAKHLRALPDMMRAFWSHFQTDLEVQEGETTITAADAESVAAAKQSLLALDKGAILYEDFVPALLLDGLVNGFDNHEFARQFSGAVHAIIDEGQDYSPLHFEYLRRLLPRECGLTIVGDVYQGIDPALCLADWNHLAPVFGTRLVRSDLTRSYRSCREITNFASAILGPEARIDNVHRSGRRPRLIHLPDEASKTIPEAAKETFLADAVATETLRLQEAGHRSVAVVCRTRAEAGRLTRRLKSRGLTVRALKDQAEITSDNGGLLVVPLHLAKGLEFDAVVVADAGAGAYARAWDRRALYAACTRPLHALSLVCFGPPSSFVPPALPVGAEAENAPEPLYDYDVSQPPSGVTTKAPRTGKQDSFQDVALMIAALDLTQNEVQAAGENVSQQNSLQSIPARTSESDAQMALETQQMASLLAPWKALALEAPQWQEIEAFIVSLRILAAGKQQQRERMSAARGALSADIERMKEEFGADLSGFYTGFATWEAETCPAEQVEKALDRLGSLRTCLEAYNAADVLSAPLDQRPALRRRQEELESVVPREVTALTALLVTSNTEAQQS